MKIYENITRATPVVKLVGGALVPTVAHTLAMSQDGPLWLRAGIVTSALLFSAPSGYAWAKEVFGGKTKALGFCVLLEATMISSQYLNTAWLGWACWALLVVINLLAIASRVERKAKAKAKAAKAVKATVKTTVKAKAKRKAA